MLNPQVSIICPYFDAASFLPTLIHNVLRQTHRSWELLLIDDCSTDDGPLVAAKAAKSDPRICALSAPQRPVGLPSGPWWPRNVGLGHAHSELIAFLDVDDLWHPLKLERQIFWHLQASAALSVTGYSRFNITTRQILNSRVPPSAFGYGRLRMSNIIPMLTALVDRRLLVDQFRPCCHEDYLFWLSILRANADARCIGIPEILAYYAVHDRNLTRARWKMPFWTYQVYRSHGMNSINSLLSLAPWFAIHLSQRVGDVLPGSDLTVDQLLSAQVSTDTPS